MAFRPAPCDIGCDGYIADAQDAKDARLDGILDGILDGKDVKNARQDGMDGMDGIARRI